MKNTKKRRFIISSVMTVICAIYVLFMFSFLRMLINGAIYTINFDTIYDITTMEFRTDIEPLQRRFPYYFNNSHEIFWKAARYHTEFFPLGPSDIWFKGYILLDIADFDFLKLEIDWTRVELVFEEGMEPCITGFDSFKWHSSEEMRRALRREYHYQGNFYLDKINRVLYFDFSTT